jgi:hypothetical protein
MNREQYLAAIAPAMDIVVKKHEDYNSGGVALRSYFPFGSMSYIQMLNVKTQRLVSLTLAGRDELDSGPNFESIEDTVYDLINYAVFFAMALQESPNEL